MAFDHAAADSQIASIIDYASIAFLIDDGFCEYKGLLDRESGTADLGDHGFLESREARITVSKNDFPVPPKFGCMLTVLSDGTRYVVGHSESAKGVWEVQLKAHDLSTNQD